MRLDRDRIMNADPELVGRGATALADLAQDIPDHIRPLAVAAFCRLYLERLGIEPQDAMTAVGNILASAERLGVHQFAALREYLRNDL